MSAALQRLSDAPVVVTGGNGFLGSHIVAQLLHAGARVHALTRPGSSDVRLRRFSGSVALHQADVQDAPLVEELLRHISPQIVFHLAGVLNAGLGEAQFDAAFATNVMGTLNVVRGAHRARCERVVLAGSCAEYAPSDAAVDETAELRAQTPYAASKTAAWSLALGECAGRATALVTIRLFTPYGPWERTSRLVPGAIVHCLRREPFAMTTGMQTRDYLSIDDAARAFLLAGVIDAARDQIINVGAGEEVQIRQLVMDIATLTGADHALLQFGAIPLRENELMRQRATIGKATRLLGWSPTLGLREGLEQTVRWYREHGDLLDAL